MTRIRSLLLGAVVLAVAVVFARPIAAQDVRVGPEAAWVEVRDLAPVDHVPTDEVGSTYLLLSELQVNMLDDEPQYYSDLAWYVIGPAGVQSGSTVSIDFDPAYEELTIHAIDVVRDGKRLPRLNEEDIQVLHREEDLESAMYDGRRTAHVVLTDVRPGDVVRKRYTLRGAHPALADHFALYTYESYYEPTRTVSSRLLWPADAPLRFQTHGGAEAPALATRDGVAEYRWGTENPTPYVDEEDVPYWIEPSPSTEFSNASDWSAIVRWWSELFGEAEEPGDALRGEVERIRRRNATRAERARAALEFVQDEVRYVGIELGVGAYKPTAPSVVLDRRFGDCKDKSVLLQALLRELGIEARLALVDSYGGRAAGERLPTPYAFDHMIVRVELDGSSAWVDPTATLERGELLDREPPPYGLALVLDPATTELTPIPASDPARRRVEFEKTIRAREVGAPAEILIESTYHGASADEIRYSLAFESVGDVSRSYHDYMKEDEPSARIATPLRFEDDYEANVLRSFEHYTVPDFWKEEDGEQGAWFRAGELGDCFVPVDAPGERVFPIDLGVPEQVSYLIRVELSDEWSFDDESVRIENPAFRFAYDAEFFERTNTLRLNYDYRVLVDHVEPQDAVEYADEIDDAYDLLHFGVAYSPTGVADEGGYWALWLAALGLVAAVVLLGLGVAYAVVRDRTIATFEEEADALRGRSLWLSMWMRPRATARVALDRGWQPWLLVGAMGLIALRGLSRLDLDRGEDVAYNLGVSLVPVVVGILFGPIALYAAGWMYALSGRLIGGVGTSRDVRTVLGWTWSITVVVGLLWIPRVLVAGFEAFSLDTPIVFASASRSVLIGCIDGIDVALSFWLFFAAIQGIAEAHRFSAWRALGAVLLVVGTIVFVVLVLFAVALLVSIALKVPGAG